MSEERKAGWYLVSWSGTPPIVAQWNPANRSWSICGQKATVADSCVVLCSIEALIALRDGISPHWVEQIADAPNADGLARLYRDEADHLRAIAALRRACDGGDK